MIYFLAILFSPCTFQSPTSSAIPYQHPADKRPALGWIICLCKRNLANIKSNYLKCGRRGWNYLQACCCCRSPVRTHVSRAGCNKCCCCCRVAAAAAAVAAVLQMLLPCSAPLVAGIFLAVIMMSCGRLAHKLITPFHRIQWDRPDRPLSTLSIGAGPRAGGICWRCFLGICCISQAVYFWCLRAASEKRH